MMMWWFVMWLQARKIKWPKIGKQYCLIVQLIQELMKETKNFGRIVALTFQITLKRFDQ